MHLALIGPKHTCKCIQILSIELPQNMYGCYCSSVITFCSTYCYIDGALCIIVHFLEFYFHNEKS